MRKLFYYFSVSLDGYINDSRGSLDFVLIDEELHRYFNQLEEDVDTHLYGRRMYEIMAAYWPTGDTNPDSTDVEVEYALLWQKMTKVVFSRTLNHVNWNSRLVKEDPLAEVTQLKKLPGKNMSVGGADLASTFIQHNMIDLYRVFYQPVILGGGTPMFPELMNPIKLRLIETRTFQSGVIMLAYVPLDQPEVQTNPQASIQETKG